MDKVIFLDRDGVINKDPMEKGYVTEWNEFSFLPGAKEAIIKLNKAGFKIIIISNQAGIAKGIYTEDALSEITKNMLSEIERAGGHIEKAYYCVHKNEDNCDCRKPKVGLFEKALTELKLKINYSETYFIGDGITDMEAGKQFGLKTVLLMCGKTTEEKLRRAGIKPDLICNNLPEAVDRVTDGK